ncbi:uncharacterized protein [Elaeis guineensis]|uniref:Uncharacterized protein LOC105044769 n=1 Tax=Elaeis guineensis var. tenera TaxID=51953 RepID=A0A6J0PIA3_ELAGV|nr:uncharacterized protein LOC105044769 [Elaeis guineensis]XP_019705865.1 uncharacterized protein LOC105044769 [Elaeis guineensis]
MVSSGYVKRTDEIQEEFEPAKTPSDYETKDHTSIHISTSRRGLLDEKRHGNKFLSAVAAFPGKSMFVKLGSSSRLSSSSSKFRRIAEERDDIPHSVPSPVYHSRSKRFPVPFAKKINWVSLWRMCKEWIRDPLNMALFVWIACVAISGAILFLVMTGMLNGVLPRKSQRDTWFEVNNQILNALFTLMCLYQHPKRFHHLVLLCRWRPEDVLTLQKIYCKNGTYKPNERKHMMIVVILLHINCFAQYALCGLNLGYPRSKRPAIGVGLCISVAIGAPAIASVYNILSPLGKEYETETDQEAQGQTSSAVDHRPAHLRLKSLEKRYSFTVSNGNRVAESSPRWVGGLFDFWDDISLAYLSVFCSCCVFGWNMDRLGFGNMFVHITTFLLFCLAPFFIFNLAAVNINNEAIREALGITGFVLCIFGLLYGGFWRIQMRKKFNLPGNTFCCGKPAITDCFQWLCCCSCSLAQELRTADYYDVVEDKLYLKEMNNSTPLMLFPLPREAGFTALRSSPSSSQGNSNRSLFRVDNLTSPIRSSGVLAPEQHLPIVKDSSV